MYKIKLILFVLCLSLGQIGYAHTLEMATSPKGGSLELVVKVIDSSRSSIKMAAYGLTNKTIANALINKHNSGVEVLVVADRSQVTQKFSVIKQLVSAGIAVHIDYKYAIQHSKILIIDDKTVETGSFNYTDAAVKNNSENVLVIWDDPKLAAEYSKYWQKMWDESAVFIFQ